MEFDKTDYDSDSEDSDNSHDEWYYKRKTGLSGWVDLDGVSVKMGGRFSINISKDILNFGGSEKDFWGEGDLDKSYNRHWKNMCLLVGIPVSHSYEVFRQSSYSSLKGECSYVSLKIPGLIKLNFEWMASSLLKCLVSSCSDSLDLINENCISLVMNYSVVFVLNSEML